MPTEQEAREAVMAEVRAVAPRSRPADAGDHPLTCSVCKTDLVTRHVEDIIVHVCPNKTTGDLHTDTVVALGVI